MTRLSRKYETVKELVEELRKLEVVMYLCNPSSLGVEKGESGVQGHS